MKTDKQKSIRKQTWKFFWEQKREEISEYFEDYWGIYAFAMMMIGCFSQIFWIPADGTDIAMSKVVAIIGLSMIGFWIMVGLVALVKVIGTWLSDNWEEASERAKKEHRKQKRTTKK